MKLIDVDALRADYGMAEDCKDCETGYRSCEYDRIYSKMDFCGWLDDAPTVDAVPVSWIKEQAKKRDKAVASILMLTVQEWKDETD